MRNLVVAALLAAAPLLAAEPDLAELARTARQSVYLEYSLTPPNTIGSAIEKHLDDPSSIVPALMSGFALSKEAAVAIARAELLVYAAENSMDDEATLAPRYRELADRYSAALRLAPANPHLALECIVFFNANRPAIVDSDARVDLALRRVVDRPAVLVRAITDTRTGYIGEGALVRAAVRELGLDPLLLCVIAEDVEYADAIPLLERAGRSFATHGDAPSAASSSARAMALYARLGLDQDLLRLFDGLSDGYRRAVFHAKRDVVRGHDTTFELGFEDIRYDVIASLILAGRIDEARAWFAALPPKDVSQSAREEDALSRELITVALDPRAEDSFDFLERSMRSAFGRTAILSTLLARVAAADGYGELAGWVLRGSRGYLSWSLHGDHKLDAALEPLTADFRQRLAALIEEDDSQPAGTASRRIAAERLAPFAEMPLDAAADLRGPSRCDALDALKQRGVSFPDRFHPLRVEEENGDVIAVGVSQDLDPLGEIGRGAYWVIHSRDGGFTWDKPLYTGLREEQPYALVLDSRLPLHGVDGVRLEVRVRELDQSSITFPPIALRYKRERSGLWLDMPWVDLQRDSDDDGLTDLVEERIFTDPNADDTDGDGLSDAVDAMPQVAGRSSTAAGPAALRVALAADFGENVVAAPPAAAADTEGCEMPRGSRIGERTVFVVGDAAAFTGLTPTIRIVVLTPAEFAAAEKKFGTILTTSISPVVISHDGTKAFVDINSSWRGSFYHLDKKGESWVAQAIGGFIT
jgi:hypothetical protein